MRTELLSTTLFKDLNDPVSKSGIVNATVEAIDAANKKLCIALNEFFLYFYMF